MDVFRWLRGSPRRADLAAEHYKTGLRLQRQENWQDAAAHFTKAIEISPSFVPARLARASAYFLLREWDQAISDFSEVLAANPTSVEALVGRAYTYASKAANTVERYEKIGGKQYKLSFEELDMPMDQLLGSVSPEKALWIRMTNAIVELQAAATKDAEDVLKWDSQNHVAQELLSKLRH